MIGAELIAKRCSKCRVLKGADRFGNSSKATDGHKSQCKSCFAISGAKYRLENADKEKARLAKYRLENPEKEKARQAKYLLENPDKRKATLSKYRLANLEKEKARISKWRRENRIASNAITHARRARLKGAGGKYTKEDWDNILVTWNHQCASCKCDGTLVVDHIISIKMGGSNWPHNLQPLCQPCNSSKGAKSYSFIKPI